MNSKRHIHSIPATLVSVSLPGNTACEESNHSKHCRPQSFRDKVRMIKKVSKGRARSMVIGATSVMNKWPDYLLFYWLALLAFLVFTIGCLVTFSTYGKHCRQTMLSDHDKCLIRHTHTYKKTDVLSKTNMFLHVIVNNNDQFDISDYKDVLKAALKNHPKYIINILVLFNDLLHHDFKRNSRITTWKTYHNGEHHYSFFDTSSAEKEEATGVNLVPIENEPNIHVVQSTLSNFFKHSPLKDTWRQIPQDILYPALRMLNVWEHGGIALSWGLFLDKNKVQRRNPASNSKMQELLKELKKNFSTSYIKPRNPIEIKKSMIEKIKADLTHHSDGRFPSDSSELYKIYRTLKSQYPNRIHMVLGDSTGSTTSTSEYASSSEEHRALSGLLKMTAGNLGRSSESSRYSSSSYYTGSTSSSVYEYSSEDGLPRSYESVSAEFKLRPEKPPEFVQKELMRYVNRKNTGNDDDDIGNRMGRTLLALQQDDGSDEYVMEPVKKPNKIKNPFEDLEPEIVSDEFIKNKGFQHSKKDAERDKIIHDLMTSSTESYSPSESSEYLSWESSRSSSGSDSGSSESPSLERLQKILGPMSDENHHPHLYIKESKRYKTDNAFKTINIFALPNKSTVTLDHAGFYISAKNPCNEFISELIRILKNTTDFLSADHFITASLNVYCKGKDFNKCEGVSLLTEDTM